MPNILADIEEQIKLIEDRVNRILKKIEDNETNYKRIKALALKRAAAEKDPHSAKKIMNDAIIELNSLGDNKAELEKALSNLNTTLNQLYARKAKINVT